MMAPVLPRFRLTSSADPLVLNDKGDHDTPNTNNVNNVHRANSYTPAGRLVERRINAASSAGRAGTCHRCRTITAARLDPRQIDSFFEVISKINRNDRTINSTNTLRFSAERTTRGASAECSAQWMWRGGNRS